MSTTRQVDVFTARGEARRRWTFGDRHGCFATVCATSGACTTSTRRAEREKRLTNSKYHAGSEMSRTTYTYRAGSERRRRVFCTATLVGSLHALANTSSILNTLLVFVCFSTYYIESAAPPQQLAQLQAAAQQQQAAAGGGS
eukprot:126265-Prorocentrum_minimum.AAC.1